MATFKAPPKTALDEIKMSIKGKPWTDGDNKTIPSLTLRVVGNGVRLTAYLNHPDEKADIGPMNINMNLKVVNTLLSMLNDLIDGKDIGTIGVENRGHTFFGGKRSEKAETLGKVWVTLNGDGEICLVVSHPGRKTCMFPFHCDYWATLIDKESRPLDRAVSSRYLALGWLESVKQLLGIVVSNIYKTPEPRPQQGGGGYGNSNTGNNNSGYSNAPAKKEEATDVFSDM